MRSIEQRSERESLSLYVLFLAAQVIFAGSSARKRLRNPSDMVLSSDVRLRSLNCYGRAAMILGGDLVLASPLWPRSVLQGFFLLKDGKSGGVIHYYNLPRIIFCAQHPIARRLRFTDAANDLTPWRERR